MPEFEGRRWTAEAGCMTAASHQWLPQGSHTPQDVLRHVRHGPPRRAPGWPQPLWAALADYLAAVSCARTPEHKEQNHTVVARTCPPCSHRVKDSWLVSSTPEVTAATSSGAFARQASPCQDQARGPHHLIWIQRCCLSLRDCPYRGL